MKKLFTLFFCLIAFNFAVSAQTNVSGTINANTTWNLAGSPYTVTGDVIVNTGITLTVDSNVVVRFNTNTGLQVRGSLVARGTRFTSAQTTKKAGDWNEIQIGYSSYMGSASFRNCIIEYGGRSGTYNSYAALYVDNGTATIQSTEVSKNNNGGILVNTSGVINLTGSTISNNSWPIVYMNNGVINYKSGNSYSGNTHNAALINFSSLSGSFYLDTLNIPYVFNSYFTIQAGGTMEIASGNIVKIPDGGNITVNGTLKAVAGMGKKIYFTSYRDDNLGGDSNANGTANVPSASNWTYILFNPSSVDAQCVMKRCSVSFGGGSYYGAVTMENASPTVDSCEFSNNYDGVQFRGVSKPNFRYNTIASSTRVPVAMTFDADPVFLNNTFSFSDNEYDAIGLLEGTLSENSVLKQRDVTGIPNITYVMLGTVTIPQNISLVINKGIVIKGFSGYHRFIVKGTLVSDGQDASNRIVITSVKDDNHGNPMDTNKDGTQTTPVNGDWGGIVFENTASDTSRINFCTLKYGQMPSVYYNTRYIGGGTVTMVNASPAIRNTSIQNMYHGVYAFQVSNPAIQNVEFSNSTSTPIALSVSADPVFSGTNTFVNCKLTALGIIGENLGFNGVIKKRNVAGYNNITNLLLENLTVNSGTNMDINSGIVLKCSSGTNIYVDGGFRILGAANDTVTITSIKDDNFGNPKDTEGNGSITSPANGDWGTINFRASANDAYNIIDYSRILYGGSYNLGLVTFTDAGGKVQNTLLSNSYFNGIRCEGASTPICTTNVEIKNCNSDPIAMSLKANPTLSFSGIKMKSNGNGSNGIRIIEGTLSSDATLIKRDVGGIYNIAYIIDQLTISPDATLTISPGVVIKFLNYYSNITVNGALVANGLANNKIVFTSLSDDSKGGDTNDNGNITNPARGNWFCLVFNASAKDNSNVLKNCILNYGGSAPYNYAYKQDGIVRVFDAKVVVDSCMLEQSSSSALGIFGSATPVISNNEINNITRTPVTMSMFSNPTFTNNKVSNLGIVALGICPETYSLDATLPVRNFAGYTNITYYMYGTCTINSGTKITVPAGMVFKSPYNSFFYVNGGIKVNGTALKPVIFTHESDDTYGNPKDSNEDGDLSKPNINSSYYGIDFADISNDSSYVTNAIFKYQHAGVNLQQASPRIANSTFEKCNWGVVLRGVSAPKVDTCQFNNLVYSPIIISLVSYPSSTVANTISGSTYKAIGVLSEELVQDVTLTKKNFAGINNIPYYFSGNYTIGTSVVLTVSPGVVCKFNTWANLLVKRGLMAIGGSAADSTIVFTSIADDYYGGDSNSDAKASAPGGYYTSWRGILFDNQALDNLCQLKYCVIKWAGYSGNESAITTESASPTILYCHITDNKNGIRATGASNPLINYSDIYNNDDYGVNNVNPSYTINARYNYWGSNTGPTHASNPGGTGDKVSDYVDYSGFVTIINPLMGDVSMNGFVQAYDASLVLQHVVGSTVLLPKQLKVADVSGDASVSAYDASLILQYVAGSIAAFPAELKSARSASLNGALRYTIEKDDNNALILNIIGEHLNKVSSFEVELLYDPLVISAQELVASLLTNYMVHIEKIDNQAGTVKFAFAGNRTLASDGILASIRFNLQSDAETADVRVKAAKLNETSLNLAGEQAIKIYLGSNKLKAFPNPVTDKVFVSFTTVPGKENVNLKLYTAAGQLVSMPVKGYYPAGKHTVELKLQDLKVKQGIYYLKLDKETVNLIIR
jgi:hypothetical protein